MKKMTLAFIVLAAILLAQPTCEAQSLTLDANNITFTYGGFPEVGNLTTTGSGALDLDATGGGGLVLLTGGDVNIGSSTIDVNLTVNPGNLATGFNVVLGDVDDDDVPPGTSLDPGTSAFVEDYTFFFDLTGQPTGTPITLSRTLSSFGSVTGDGVAAGFGNTIGDSIQNYDLNGIQFQNVFGDPDDIFLSVDLDSVSLSGFTSTAPLKELNGTTFTNEGGFTYGDFVNGINAFVNGNNNLEIQVDPAGGMGFGGMGLSGFEQVDFDALTHRVEVEAKLISGNVASSFNLGFRDNDGDDSGPGAGSEVYGLSVPTGDLNETDFTTLEFAFSEMTRAQAFGFTNDGDMVQNFDLDEIILSQASNDDFLGVEIVTVAVVPITFAGIAGDFNNDGSVDAADYTVWRDNLGSTDESSLNGNGNGLNGVDQDDYELWAANFGSSSSTATATSVPEPSAIVLLGTICLMQIMGSQSRGTKQC